MIFKKFGLSASPPPCTDASQNSSQATLKFWNRMNSAGERSGLRGGVKLIQACFSQDSRWMESATCVRALYANKVKIQK